MAQRDFPASAQEMWDVLAKALMLRCDGAVKVTEDELRTAAATEAEIELLSDGSISFRVERC